MTTHSHDAPPAHTIGAEALDQVTRYCCGSMMEDEAERFEDRLVEDEEFFDQVAPFLKVWSGAASARQRAAATATATTPAVIPIARRGLRTTVNRNPKLVLAFAVLAAAAVAFAILRQTPPSPFDTAPPIARAPTSPTDSTERALPVVDPDPTPDLGHDGPPADTTRK